MTGVSTQTCDCSAQGKPVSTDPRAISARPKASASATARGHPAGQKRRAAQNAAAQNPASTAASSPTANGMTGAYHQTFDASIRKAEPIQ
jgi:hypothetical protein